MGAVSEDASLILRSRPNDTAFLPKRSRSRSAVTLSSRMRSSRSARSRLLAARVRGLAPLSVRVSCGSGALAGSSEGASSKSLSWVGLAEKSDTATPTSLTGVPGLQATRRSPRAARPKTASLSVASSSWHWAVWVVVASNLSFRVTRRPLRPFLLRRAPTRELTCAMAASTSASSVRSCEKVRSFETDFGASRSLESLTTLRSRPRARSRSLGPETPSRASSSAGSARPSSPRVRIPAPASLAWVAAPMPLIARTGRGARKEASMPGMTTVRPRGLSRSEATLAMVLLVPSPMEQVTPRALTSSCSSLQTRMGSRPARPGVTSKKASSMETCSTRGVRSRMRPMTSLLTCR